MQDTPHITEELLYYIWSLKRFDLTDLNTTKGSPIQIINWGHRNKNSGPDFLEAKIKIGNETWAGHVEMHVKASDWRRHRHQNDAAFSNVILHVVFEADEEIVLVDDEELACLELQNRVAKPLISHYKSLIDSQYHIPCQGNLAHVDLQSPAVIGWYESILVERLISKTKRIDMILEHTQGDWEEAFYRMLGRNFGFKVNGDTFEALTIALPRKILLKYRSNLKQIEALIFGQAGMLEGDWEDSYPGSLKEEFQHLKSLHNLAPLSQHRWKFMRLRPANFPTIRLAQFAVLIYGNVHLFSRALAAASIKELLHMFRSEVSGYWKTHYRFEMETLKTSKKLGVSSICLILINTVIPFLFHFGKVNGQLEMQEKALEFLQEIKAEKNKIIEEFSALNFQISSAFDSQALLQLYSEYCKNKRCLECAIGNKILRE